MVNLKLKAEVGGGEGEKKKSPTNHSSTSTGSVTINYPINYTLIYAPNKIMQQGSGPGFVCKINFYFSDTFEPVSSICISKQSWFLKEISTLTLAPTSAR